MKRSTTVFKILSLVFCLALLSVCSSAEQDPSPAPQQEKPNILFVFDANCRCRGRAGGSYHDHYPFGARYEFCVPAGRGLRADEKIYHLNYQVTPWGRRMQQEPDSL